MDEQASPASCGDSMSDILQSLGQSLNGLDQVRQRTAIPNHSLVSLSGDLAFLKSALESVLAYMRDLSLFETLGFELYLDLDTALKGSQLLATDIHDHVSLLMLAQGRVKEVVNLLSKRNRWKRLSTQTFHVLEALNALLHVFKSHIQGIAGDGTDRAVLDRVHNETLSLIRLRNSEMYCYQDTTYRYLPRVVLKPVKGSFLSKYRVSANVDVQIELDRKSQLRECKIVFFGNSKACDAMWNEIYSKYMKIDPDKIPSLRSGLCHMVLAIVRGILQHSLTLTTESAHSIHSVNASEIESAIESLDQIMSEKPEFVPGELARTIKELWTRINMSEDGLKTMIRDNMMYENDIVHSFQFLDNISFPEWKLDIADFKTHSFLPRLGEHAYKVQFGRLTLEFIHPRKTRCQMEKWRHQYEDIHLSLFAVDASDYRSQYVVGDTAPLPRTVELFGSVSGSTLFSKASPIFIMSNVECLERELQQHPLEEYCPDYSGGADAAKATEYMVTKFKQGNKSRRNMYTIVCHRFDDASEKMLCGAARDVLVRRGLESWGFHKEHQSSSEMNG